MSLPKAIQTYIADAISAPTPGRVMEFSAQPSGPALAVPTDVIHVDFTTHTALSSLQDYGRPNVAIVLGATHSLKRLGVERLLAGLRNAGVETIIAVSDKNTANHLEPWHIADYLALGFRRAEGSRMLSPEHHVYRYDLHDYKLTPSWLNARSWANPGQWGKQRW